MVFDNVQRLRKNYFSSWKKSQITFVRDKDLFRFKLKILFMEMSAHLQVGVKNDPFEFVQDLHRLFSALQ